MPQVILTPEQYKNEQWRQAVGYEYYDVSNMGRVRRKSTGMILCLSCEDLKSGGTTTYVYLVKNGTRCRTKVSILKLMGKTWLRIPDGMAPYRISADAMDNSVDNIGICTETERWQMYRAMSGVPTLGVLKINRSGEILDSYPSVCAAARACYMAPKTVRDRIFGKTKKPWTDGWTLVSDHMVRLDGTVRIPQYLKDSYDKQYNRRRKRS